MLRERWNDGWSFLAGKGEGFFPTGQEQEQETVTLPHDAMIHETRDPACKSGGQTGFFPGNVYTYVKKFRVPAQWEDKTAILEFEGVNTHAMVYVNGDYAGGQMYGYSNFYICMDDMLRYGEENEVKVVANSLDQSSRWYPGAGIYRDVNLMVADRLHIATDGVRVSTPDVEADYAVASVDIRVRNQSVKKRRIDVVTEILDGDGKTAGLYSTPLTAYAGKEFSVRQRLALEDVKRWSCESPYLYTCRVRLMEAGQCIDETVESFGIRKLQLDAKRGLRINGETVKLRGTCIHHDNGLIGACTLYRAEERRCLQLKEAGFNCIRSAHHPMGKAMLEACDRHGMLVMDELWDMWTRTKNPNDYANHFSKHWEEDVEKIVAKDFNHPCVILYSMGNEIQEVGTAQGACLNRKIQNKLNSLDDTRFTTNALNGLLAGMAHMGEILQEATGKSMEELLGHGNSGNEAGSEEGSNLLNGLMGLLSSGAVADGMAVSPILSGLMDEYASGMDVTGYNYLTALHEKEKELHPNRVVLGSETYPADIVRLWDIVERNPHVIGDMTWTGYDYLGEAGCGIFYYDGKMNFGSNWPDIAAYIGDIDLIGYRKPISYLRQIVFRLRKDPYVAVLRMDRDPAKTSQTPWMWKDNIASWTWPGFEGKDASVDVYARGDEVELFLNGESLGKKKTEGYTATFRVPYAPGILRAVNYQEGRELGSFELYTADMDVELSVMTDRTELAADGADLSYITVGFADSAGRENLRVEKEVHVSVEGSGTLQGFGSANPQPKGNYDGTSCPSYDGFVMAVVRAGSQPGEIRVKIQAEGCEDREVVIEVKAE